MELGSRSFGPGVPAGGAAAATTLLVCLTIVPAVRAQITTITDTANTPIPENSCAEFNGTGQGIQAVVREVVVNSAGLITDLNVGFRATHTWRADIQAGLRFDSFGGFTVGPIALINNHGFSSDNYYATLDSAAASTCVDACANGAVACDNAPGVTCRPDASLDAFNGLVPRGTFSLYVCDKEVMDTGTLLQWSLTIKGTSKARDVDANGVVDALTDGILTLRFEFGFRGNSLVTGAVAGNCTRCSAAEIEAYLNLEYGD
jgi:hypothetical protein